MSRLMSVGFRRVRRHEGSIPERNRDPRGCTWTVVAVGRAVPGWRAATEAHRPLETGNREFTLG
jgi:hypothetical protein